MEKEKVDARIEGINTVLVIKGGCLRIGSLEELKKENYYYQLDSRINGTAMIDYDKTDIVPLVKDVLNRQNTFLEIKLLRVLLVLSGVMILALVVIGLIVPHSKPDFTPEKSEIIAAIAQIPGKIVIPQAPPAVITPSQALIPSTIENESGSNQTIISTGATIRRGYNPIPMSEPSQIIHKNIPENGE